MFSSDMYSFGVLLLHMHHPIAAAALVPGSPHLPHGCEPDLADLVQKLLVVNATLRPTAASALMHPYFRTTFVERLLNEGEVVEQVCGGFYFLKFYAASQISLPLCLTEGNQLCCISIAI